MEEQENLEYDILTLLDEEGNEHEFELVDSVESDDIEYLALIPVYKGSEEMLQDSSQLVIMRVVEAEEDEEPVLDIVQDDEEYDKMSKIFSERLDNYFDFLYDDDQELDEE